MKSDDERCYVAFYWTLEHIFLESGQPVLPQPFSLCDLLSNMDPFTFTVGMSADPACYEEYRSILEKITTEDEAAVPSGYLAGREFIRFYMTEYDYALEDTLRSFTPDAYRFAYEKAEAETGKP